MDAIRIIILFGIVVVAILFGLGMFQEDEMIPAAPTGTDAAAESDQVHDSIRVEYDIFAYGIVIILIALAFIVVIGKYFGRII